MPRKKKTKPRRPQVQVSEPEPEPAHGPVPSEAPKPDGPIAEDDGLRIEFDLGSGLKLATIGIDRLREQDLNARTMPREMFAQLVKNIEHRGGLESIPYCAHIEGNVEIVSGHHRVRAARVAGIRRLPILLDERAMSRSEIRAKQLAHNTLSGIDDPVMLKQIYALIDDADLRRMAFVDEKALELPELPNTDLAELDVGMESQHLSLFFLPHQLKKFDKLIERLNGDETHVLLASIEDWEKFRTAILEVMDTCEVRSLGTSISKMCDLALERLKETKAEKAAA